MAGNIQSKPLSRGKSTSLKGIFDRLPQRKNSSGVPPSPGPPSSSDSDGTPVPVKPKFRWDDGRRFHDVDGAAYVLPNDTEEVDRLHQQHYMLKLAFNGNYRAPVHDLLTEGANVLDIGCGPATWMMELAHDYPLSQFYGVDISHVFPETIKPANCQFQIANVLEGLPFPNNTFDYVNQRMLTFAIKEVEWPGLIKEILRVTKPGGWIELLEYDMQPYNCGPLNAEGLKPTFYAFKSRGINPYMARKLDQYLVKAGVVNVSKDWSSVPLNWGGRLGQLFYEDMKEVLVSFRPYLTKATGLSNEEYDAMIKANLEESKEYKTYNNFHTAWGQAPDESAEKV